MKNIPLFAGIIFLVVGGFLILRSEAARAAGQEVETTWGSVIIPAGWKVEHTDGSGGLYKAYSPDYVVTDFTNIRIGEGEYRNSIAVGMEIHVFNEPTEVSKNIQSPEKFIAFEESIYEDCSNCEGKRVMTLANYPTFFMRSTADDHGGHASAKIFVDGAYMTVSFAYAQYTPDVQHVIDQTLNSVRFR